MATDFSNRHTSELAASQFQVEIPGVSLPFEVDEVTGLGAGKITIASYRRSGTTLGYKEHFPMLVETPEITFTGVYLPNFSDIGQLFTWHKQTLGEIPGNLEDLLPLKRTIKVLPVFRKYDGSVIETDRVLGQYVLYDCDLTDLSISNFSSASTDPSQWSITVKPYKVDTVLGGGE